MEKDEDPTSFGTRAIKDELVLPPIFSLFRVPTNILHRYFLIDDDDDG